MGVWWGFATTDPPRLMALAALSPSCASASPRLHGVVHNTPSPMAGGAATVGCGGGFVAVGAYLWHAEAWGVWNIFCNFVSWNETNNFF